jgi:hypothetical protein
MKVNPVSIQSYQQIAQRDRTANNAQAIKSEEQSLTIKPEKSTVSSALAVKLPNSTYADYLSAEENQALEILFGKFRASGNFAPGSNNNATDETAVGKIIDVKV